MKSLWIVLALVAYFGVYAKAVQPGKAASFLGSLPRSDSLDAQAEYNYDDYFNYDDLDELDKVLKEISNEKPVNEKTDIENDFKVEEEIQQFRDAAEDKSDALDNVDGIQLEGNKNLETADVSIVDDGKMIDDIIENRPEPDDPNAPRNKDYALLWGDDSIAPLPVPEEQEEDKDKAIFDETKQILEDKDNNDSEEEIEQVFKIATEQTPEEQPNQEQIVEETKQILNEKDSDNFEEDIKKVFETEIDPKSEELSSQKQSIESDSKDDVKESNESEPEEEDTVDKAYADLNADLDKLFDTLAKLKQEVPETSDTDENANATEKPKEIVENSDNTKTESNNTQNKDNSFDNDKPKDSEEVIEGLVGYEALELDKLLENILAENDFEIDESAAEVFQPLLNDAINEPNPDDSDAEDAEIFGNERPIQYLDDALFDEVKENAETVENTNDNNTEDENMKDDASIEKEVDVKTVSIDDLNSSELADLVKQFQTLHSEDLDVHSENFDKNVAPIHITLKLDEPTVITSPNYPSPYPTNNIVDWILEGPGVGFELNITEFAVNGGLGDYLLIKPGGIDDSGNDGFLFTYRLTAERRYRFTDVDRLFMRFESKMGMMFFRGFSISAKMIAPLTTDQDEIPEPEAVLSPPHSTATITLAARVPDFQTLKEDFRLILADMAAQYIADNDVDPGVNSTAEVTTISHVGLCPIAWPNYEECSAVTFAVSLEYEEEGHDPRLNQEDLTTMWVVYSKRDPFALKLRALGIHEFNGPDNGVLANWLLIGCGVVVTMMVVAFVLWRYSCFEDYTRMKAYSDTDSLHNEKRNMDLYPTPHQNLPPLYAEHEYKWPEEDAARVDMGGFANRNYARDNMYDFDSDEDVIPSRDRQGVVTAKDFSSNV